MPEPRLLDHEEAELLKALIDLRELRQIYVSEYGGKRQLQIGAGLVKESIKEMVILATAAYGEVPYVEAEGNGIVIRAYPGDDGEALGNAWWKKMADNDNSQVVTLRHLREGEEPRNNDGRSDCYWCGAPTREIELALSKGSVCSQCGR